LVQRRPPELARQLANGIAHLVRVLANLTRAPVLPAQLVEDGATHAQGGETAELLVGGAIAAQAVEQAHQADLLHVLAVEHLVGLQRQLADDALDQRQVLQQPLLLGPGAEHCSTALFGSVAIVDGAVGVHEYSAPVPAQSRAASYWTISLLTSTLTNGSASFLLPKSSNG